MFVIVGYIFLFACVFGSFSIHGKLIALWQPIEIVIILGAAIGSTIVGFGGAPLKATIKALPSIFKGTSYSKSFYMDLFALLYELLQKVRKEGLMSIEGDVEDPHASPLFSKYPKVSHDHHVVEFVTDYLRLMVGGNLNAFEIENLMDVEIDTHHHEAAQPAAAIAKLTDGLPAFGIVAAVMGVVNTMGSLHLPPTELGPMVGAALVGTFLGILMAYGIFGPISVILERKAEEGTQVFNVIKVTLLASLNGYAPQVAVEFGRKALNSTERPRFAELEEFVKNAKNR